MATQERVLAAAAEEFTAYGVDGARINRIATNARASKERIYAWFGDKESLFDSIMQCGLDELAEAVPISTDLVDYTVRLHDVFTARPDLQRVAVWAWLHDGSRPTPLAAQRLDSYRHKIRTITEAQRDGLVEASWEPHHLLVMLITLATSWLMAPAEVRQIAADSGASAERRAQVRFAAERLLTPHPAKPGSTIPVQ
ncbi:hypothetical protein ADK55_07670 [Streptomyces sp. WM4235]|nr:hypothetical protein ADK55_07670 [Streptomyces sp. WM4235]